MMNRKTALLLAFFLLYNNGYAAQAKLPESKHDAVASGGIEEKKESKEAKLPQAAASSSVNMVVAVPCGTDLDHALKLYDDGLAFFARANDIEAVALMEKAAGLNYAPANYWLGDYFYNHSDYRSRDVAKGFGYWLTAAEQGDRDACCCVGTAAYRGQYPYAAKDEALALAYLEKAADKGSGDAINCIFEMAWHLYRPAYACLEKLACHSEQIQHRLGLHYYHSEQWNDAGEHFVKAAEKGYQPSWDSLLKMAEQGDESSLRYLELRAKEKQLQALCCMGRFCYNRGRRDPDFAVRAYDYLLEAARDYNVPQAKYYLGLCIWYGIGVRMNKAVAAKWFKVAKADGYKASYPRVCLNSVGTSIKDPIWLDAYSDIELLRYARKIDAWKAAMAQEEKRSVATQ
jgi:TPR repeat protein